MFLPLLLSVITISTNTVTFTAKASGVAVDAAVEFLFAGPGSDRDYETLFLTDDPLTDIVAAMKKSGIPAGTAYDVSKCNFWPTGGTLAFEPALTNLIRALDPKMPISTPVFCGGNGDTNMPLAVFALFNCAQSPILMDESYDQSAAYNNFRPAKFWEKGTPMTFKVSFAGKVTQDITPDFPADKTFAEAKKVAEALAKVDSVQMKINGAREGQFYYCAFIPKAQWLDRKERLVQPLEIYLTATNETYTVIDEDWSGPGNDPILTPRTVPFEVVATNDNNAAFFYAPLDTRLQRLYELRAKLPKDFRTFYIYPTDEAK